MDVGSVEYVVIAFPGNRFSGEIMPELRKLVADGIVRVVDLSFIKKDSEGAVQYLELSALEPDEASIFDDLDGEIDGLLSQEDLAIIADALDPDSSAALLVWENTWAAGITSAIRRAGGQLVARERVPAPIVAEVLNSAA
ncbi:DUF6325 family protein [Streptacidiphilus neutrinimicus]|uniref:DUF6325 family protein n=1 Tax=Streptacidiphilus neutrinimicus TaxID=105420 RepID=UPI0005AB3898|nr:DUF6325 family protein [Streptacidiphilus neutrinimicus]